MLDIVNNPFIDIFLTKHRNIIHQKYYACQVKIKYFVILSRKSNKKIEKAQKVE
jgi:hypothetical protein